VIALGGAALLALLAWTAITFWPGRGSPVAEVRDAVAPCRLLVTRLVFWSSLPVLGVVTTALGNRLFGDFLFTWPAALFSVHQVVLAGMLWSHRHRDEGRARWLPLTAALSLLLACLVYYDLCRRCDLAMMWLFLVGLVPSWPLAVPAAHHMAAAVRPFRDMLGAALAFSAYFWISAAYAWWILGR
jgi:hypothetical protein